MFIWINSSHLLEMSYFPPSASECSPDEPRTYRWICSIILFFLDWVNISKSSRHLKLPFIGHFLQRLHPSPRQEGQLDVNRSPDRGAQVRRAEGEPPEPLVRGEGHEGVHVLDPVDQELEHTTNVSTGGHRDDPEVVLLTNPHQECLLLVVENSPPCWPVSTCICRLCQYS